MCVRVYAVWCGVVWLQRGGVLDAREAPGTLLRQGIFLERFKLLSLAGPSPLPPHPPVILMLCQHQLQAHPPPPIQVEQPGHLAHTPSHKIFPAWVGPHADTGAGSCAQPPAPPTHLTPRSRSAAPCRRSVTGAPPRRQWSEQSAATTTTTSTHKMTRIAATQKHIITMTQQHNAAQHHNLACAPHPPTVCSLTPPHNHPFASPPPTRPYSPSDCVGSGRGSVRKTTSCAVSVCGPCASIWGACADCEGAEGSCRGAGSWTGSWAGWGSGEASLSPGAYT